MMDYQIVAMINRSAGNESVGDMWTETKIFHPSDTLQNVYTWASERLSASKKFPAKIEDIKLNVKLSIAQ